MSQEQAAFEPDGTSSKCRDDAEFRRVRENNLARLETDGWLDRTLNLSIPDIFATAVQPDGKILIGGQFTHVLGVLRTCIARLNPDCTLDTAFAPNASRGIAPAVHAIVVQPNGTILLGGAFSGVGGQNRQNFARVDATTGAADSFNPDADETVYAIAVQPDGKILVGGQFKTVGGMIRSHVARLDPVTGAADGFNPNADGTVETVALQPDGKVLAGGVFTAIGGQTRNRIARLNATTGLADSFNPNADFPVRALAVQPDGKVLAGGLFTSIGGQTRPKIARLDPGTGLADSFAPSPNANSVVSTIAIQADGKILLGGLFSTLAPNGGGPITRNNIARLHPEGTLDIGFDANANTHVASIALQTDGKVLTAGGFTTIGSQPRSGFARLSNDSAQQNVAVSQTAVTWTRGSSSPQFMRVTFESSTDSVNYTPLGNGTTVGSNWTLSGLSLPAGQNIYIRARGYYRSGYSNGSESMAESIRNAFLTTLQLAAAVSRKTHGAAGAFDVPLPLTGEPGVECRSSGGAHTMIFTFNNNVVSGHATVTLGTGGVSGSPTFSANAMTVNLSGIADVQKLTVTLSGVTDSSAQVLPDTGVSVNMLVADINASKAVNASDIGAVKAQSGQSVTASNFRTDVAVSGSITASDIGLVKSRSGQSVP